MIITKLKNAWATPELCWLIRIGKIRATIQVRSLAKQITFVRAYGFNGH